jgi:hypothetical protein
LDIHRLSDPRMAVVMFKNMIALTCLSLILDLSGHAPVADPNAQIQTTGSHKPVIVGIRDGLWLYTQAHTLAKVVGHPDAVVIATGDWEEWNVPLSRFTSAGVSLNSVNRIILGVEDRISPKAGGAGKLSIDDIRLTRMDAP